eukprot:g3978.t1
MRTVPKKQSRAKRLTINNLPVRKNRSSNGKLLKIDPSALRLVAKETMDFQEMLQDVIQGSEKVPRKELHQFLDENINIRKLWWKTLRTKWERTEQNLRKLSENVLQCCMIHIRSGIIGRVDPEQAMKRFSLRMALDFCEFLAIVNMILFFYWGKTSPAVILLSCVILERFLQSLANIAIENSSFGSIIGCALGIKTFFDAYTISCRGPLEVPKGERVNIGGLRMLHKGLNGIVVSTPQLALNSYLIFSKISSTTDVRKLTLESRILGLIIILVALAFGISLTNLVQELEYNTAAQGRYTSMTRIILPTSERLGISISKSIWNTTHYLLVTCALGALIALTEPYVLSSIVIVFLIIVNVARYIVNKGELRYFTRFKKSLAGNIMAYLIPTILLPLGPGAWVTFFWSNRNWKDVLSEEYWNNPNNEKVWNSDMEYNEFLECLQRVEDEFLTKLDCGDEDNDEPLLDEEEKPDKPADSTASSKRNALSLKFGFISKRKVTNEEKPGDNKMSSTLNAIGERLGFTSRGNGAKEGTPEKQFHEKFGFTTRREIAKNLKKRRSSMALHDLMAAANTCESVNDIPTELIDLFESAESLQVEQIIEQSKRALDDGLFDKLLGSTRKSSAKDIIFVIFQALLAKLDKQ